MNHQPANHPSETGGKLTLILAILTAVTLLIGLGIVAVGGVAYLALQRSTIDYDQQLRSDPMIAELIGDVTLIEVDNVASSEIAETDTRVYDIQGTRGQGKVVMRKHITKSGDEQIETATLHLDTATGVKVMPLDY